MGGMGCLGREVGVAWCFFCERGVGCFSSQPVPCAAFSDFFGIGCVCGMAGGEIGLRTFPHYNGLLSAGFSLVRSFSVGDLI